MSAPDPPARSRGPIIIIGAMGSGTTLLRLMLDSHEHIAIPEETGFMRIYNSYRFTPFKYSGGETMARLGWTDEGIDEFLREHFHQLFMNYAQQHGKQRWGEKSPLHTWHVENMARLFPDAQFVMIVRHPAASIHSNLRRFRRYEGDRKQPRWHWDAYTRRIAQYSEVLGDRMMLLRYEELVLHPEKAMRELLEWLGEPWSDDVLRHHEVQGRREIDVAISGKSKVDDPIDRSRIDKWKTTMPAADQRAVTRRLGPLARFWGYDAEDPAVLDPLHDGDTLLTPGPALAARIDRFPDLDIRRPLKPPPIDELMDPRYYMPVTRERFVEIKKREDGSVKQRPGAAPGIARAVAARLPDRVRGPLVRFARRVRD
jgi:hypothetical protein